MAVKMVISSVFEFEEFSYIERLKGFVNVDNKASQRVMEKAGFQKEGQLLPLSQIRRCSDADDGAPMMVMGSTATRYAMRTRDCNDDGYLVHGKTWFLTAQWVVCGWSMGVGGLNGWHWVFGNESQVVPEISSRSPRTAASLVAGKNGELKRLGVTVELVRVLQRTGGMGF
ncbi:uncharacterized N-acetyltransferase p20-like isoform X1 [Fagus crenata]